MRRGGYADQAAAEAALDRVLDGADPEAGATLGEWLRVWVAGCGRLAASTRVSYTEHINVYIVPALGNIPLAELAIKDLDDFYLALARRRTRMRGSTLSAGTVTRIHATLRAALNAAMRRGLIAWNPAREVEPPGRHRPRAAVWTEDLIAHWKATGERPSVAVCAGLDVEAPSRYLELGTVRRLIFDDLRAWKAAGVQGSPHSFFADGASMHDPGIDLTWHQDGDGEWHGEVTADDPAVYAAMLGRWIDPRISAREVRE